MLFQQSEVKREDNRVAFYLKSKTDTYNFSLAIWNSITKEYPNKNASAIRKCKLMQRQKHNYYYKY